MLAYSKSTFDENPMNLPVYYVKLLWMYIKLELDELTVGLL